MITPHRAINAILLTVILGLYALMAYLDGPTDHHTEMAQAADLQAAIKAEAAEARFAHAVAALCGENAAARRIDNTTVQCMTKRGYRTQKVAL